MVEVGGERPTSRRSLVWCAALQSLLLASCAGGAGGPGGSPSGASHPLVGAPAPAFELRDVAGSGLQSPASHAGKVVIVDFWATWCVPCKQSFSAYQKLVEKLGGELVVVGVSQDEDDQGIAAFRSETGATFPLVWDDGKAVARSYDPPSMPTAYVIDRNGIVRFVHVGYRTGDEAALEEEVRSLLR
jgi:peroxiredoxin